MEAANKALNAELDKSNTTAHIDFEVDPDGPEGPVPAFKVGIPLPEKRDALMFAIGFVVASLLNYGLANWL